MPRLSTRVIRTFVLATLAGSCLHFVYAFLPNPITALFSPVNESLWEHLKILFWPGLVSALILSRGADRGTLAHRLLSLLLAGAAMLCVGYGYHILLGGESLAFDIILYVLAMALCFLLPGAFRKPFSAGKRELVVLITAAVGAAILLFTFLPPAWILFTDLSGANTWSRIPC